MTDHTSPRIKALCAVILAAHIEDNEPLHSFVESLPMHLGGVPDLFGCTMAELLAAQSAISPVVATYADGSGPYEISVYGAAMVTTIGTGADAEILYDVLTRAPGLDGRDWSDYMLTPDFASDCDADAVLINGRAYWTQAVRTPVPVPPCTDAPGAVVVTDADGWHVTVVRDRGSVNLTISIPGEGTSMLAVLTPANWDTLRAYAPEA